MIKQTTNHILMIRPVRFRYNEQTAENNYYQNAPKEESNEQIQKKALQEFNNFVSTLKDNQLKITVVEDSTEPSTPDSIFPNNWISFHQDGQVVIYPMFAENRRAEKRSEVIDQLIERNNLKLTSQTDFSYFEEQEVFLEGTGSMILDRQNKLAYAAVSERMHIEALNVFCEKMDYKPVIFHALQNVDGERLAIYHTNVMMCLGETFAVICLDSIDNITERNNVIKTLNKTYKEIINITEDQVIQFAGNMLETVNEVNERLLIMSSAAFQSLTNSQKETLKKHCRIIHSDISTIEKYGGGSARCMMAEVFLPYK